MTRAVTTSGAPQRDSQRGETRVGLKKAGLRFAQEVPVKGFTVDFLIDEWLVVEVDGESHLCQGEKREGRFETKGHRGNGIHGH